MHRRNNRWVNIKWEVYFKKFTHKFVIDNCIIRLEIDVARVALLLIFTKGYFTAFGDNFRKWVKNNEMYIKGRLFGLGPNG
jgi:hypothetical protein